MEFDEKQLARLKDLGTYLNYNGYGSDLDDLYFHPADLFLRTSQFDTPDQFMNEDSDTFKTLQAGYNDDMQRASSIAPSVQDASSAVFQLPDAAWSRRVSGVFGNDLANQHPARAHAVVTEKSANHFVVSVRAPLRNKKGADVICRQFPTGGGRAAAAGINELTAEQLSDFVGVFTQFYKT